MSGRPPVVLVHPRGTYKSSPFYFRGDDALKEPEYLMKERQDLEAQLKKVTKELEKEKKIYDQTNEELKKRDEFTVSLASALGTESEATAENADLRHQLAELTTKIEGTERAISKFKTQQQLPVITAYQKEKAFYETEIEDLRIKILDGVDDIKDGKEALGRVVCSDEFATANIASGLLHSKKTYYGYLRKELTDKINQINSVAGTGLLKGPSPKLPVEVENLILRKQKMNTQKAALDRECKRKIFTARDTALALVNQIARMNEILVALGGEKYDTEPLKEKYSNMDFTEPCERDEDEEQERSTEEQERSTEEPESTEHTNYSESHDDNHSDTESHEEHHDDNESDDRHKQESDNEKHYSDKDNNNNESDDKHQSQDMSVHSDHSDHDTTKKSNHNSREGSRAQTPQNSRHSNGSQEQHEQEHVSDYNYEKPKEEEDAFDKSHENTDLIIKDYDQDHDSDRTLPKDNLEDEDVF